jgi:hypothetical protein
MEMESLVPSFSSGETLVRSDWSVLEVQRAGTYIKSFKNLLRERDEHNAV